MESSSLNHTPPEVEIFHNPRCSKSREALELVKRSGLSYNIIEYLKTPPTVAQLADICAGLGKEPTEMIRVKEKLFQELGLSLKDNRSRREWLDIMVENPKLIERPIIIRHGKYALGRPPETVLKILK